MEASNENVTPTSVLCAQGCGFFGNPQTMGMCSKCYKDIAVKEKSAPPAAQSSENPQSMSVCPAARSEQSAALPASTPAPELTPSSGSPGPLAPLASATAASAVGASQDADEPAKPAQANTSRCWTCNKKIGLLGFQCKCEYFFCAGHRASDKHVCTFDYKSMGKHQLTQANPTITPEKLEGF